MKKCSSSKPHFPASTMFPRLINSGGRLALSHHKSTTTTTKLVCNNSLHTKASSTSAPTSAYIHLPFCRKRCFYCDFPIVALGSSPDHEKHLRMENYANLICKEISSTPKGTQRVPLETIFFGGGTPSLMPTTLLSTIFDCIDKEFGTVSAPEISIEMDPGTFDANKLSEFMGLGISRVSLGVQSFQEKLLKTCGRAHGVSEVYEAIDSVHKSGLQNWSLDLISSLPNQTIEDWEDSLRQAVDARPNHVSVYDLQIEDGTKFGKMYEPGIAPLPSEDCSAEFYKLASRTLRYAGYEHYEISNYAKPGFQCRHNMVYWQNRPCYGFGLGAASYVDGVRFSRPRRMGEYASYVDKLGNCSEVVDKCQANDDRERAMDIVMLSLRLARGLELKVFAEAFGWGSCVALCKVLSPYLKSGHVVPLGKMQRRLSGDELDAFCAGLEKGSLDCINANGVKYLRLSDPEGFLLSNELISTAFASLSSIPSIAVAS